jgi:energy-converting hydrogenase Eha subunit H
MRQHLVWIGACMGIVVGFVVAAVFRYKWELEVDFNMLFITIAASVVLFAGAGETIALVTEPSKARINN